MSELLKGIMPLVILLISNIITILPSVSTNTEAVKNLKESVSEIKKDMAEFKKTAEVNFDRISKIDSTVELVAPIAYDTNRKINNIADEQQRRTDIITWSRQHRDDINAGKLRGK